MRLGRDCSCERLAPLSFRQATNKLDVDSFCCDSYLPQGSGAQKLRGLHYLKLLWDVILLFYLGIDIGKNNHVASMLDDAGKPMSLKI